MGKGPSRQLCLGCVYQEGEFQPSPPAGYWEDAPGIHAIGAAELGPAPFLTSQENPLSLPQGPVFLKAHPFFTVFPRVQCAPKADQLSRSYGGLP